MKRETYGNYVLYYEETFAVYAPREHEDFIEPETAMKALGHGFMEASHDEYTGDTYYHGYRPTIPKKEVELEMSVFTRPGGRPIFLLDRIPPLKCISTAKNIGEVYGERGIKCGNRHLRKLFGRFIEIDNRAPIFARFEGTYKDYQVKGINLGHTFFPEGLRYLMYSDRLHFGATVSPHVVYTTMKKYEKKYPREEIVGYINNYNTTGRNRVKIRREYHDHTTDVIVSAPPTYPVITEDGIELKEVPPEKYETALNQTEKLIDDLGLKVTKVKILNNVVILQSDTGKVILTPQTITIARGPTLPNNRDTIPYLIAGLHYPPQIIE